MKRTLILVAAGLLAVPAMAQSSATGSPGSTGTSITESYSGSDYTTSDYTPPDYPSPGYINPDYTNPDYISPNSSDLDSSSADTSASDSSAGPEGTTSIFSGEGWDWNAWQAAQDRAMQDQYLGTFGDQERVNMQSHLQELNTNDQRAYLDLMNSMSSTDRDLWNRSFNAFNSNVPDSDNFEETLTPPQSTTERYFGSLPPVDRTIAEQWWNRLGDYDRSILMRVMEPNASENDVLADLPPADQSTISQWLSTLSDTDQTRALNMLQRLTPEVRQIFAQTLNNSTDNGANTSVVIEEPVPSDATPGTGSTPFLP